MLTRTHKKALINERRNLEPNEISAIETLRTITKKKHPPEIRIQAHITSTRNPYVYSHHGIQININFSEEGIPVNELLAKYFSQPATEEEGT